MYIDFNKNIAVIMIGISHKPTDEDERDLIDTTSLDYPYKIHILINDGNNLRDDYFSNLYDYIELIHMYNCRSKLFVHWKRIECMDNLIKARFSNYMRFDKLEKLRIGNILYRKRRGYYHKTIVIDPIDHSTIRSIPQYN